MTGPRKIALCVAYHGAAFHGFQRQPGFPTVQEELERAWTAVTGETVVVHGSGRTDSGVHAWGQVVHLSTWSRLPAEKVRPALNAYLPEEAAVRVAAEVPADFHSRLSARGKRYLYRLAVSPVRPVLYAGLVGWERRSRPLEVAAMRQAARGLVGRHDFAAYAAAGRSTQTTVRTLRSIRIRPVRGGVSFLFQGDGFLYKMVRNLVGTLSEVGRGTRAPEWPRAVLDSLDRRRAGATAPPEGLCLWRVLYPRDPFAGVPSGPPGAYPRGSDPRFRPPENGSGPCLPDPDKPRPHAR
ncbi:MAG: tRNA pseudouridine(38-40) synthase TruA [Planctomycetes bacterium]|nr:tRNA pseudouridine(38-40) synthase TruA [Planctomycetota bacterium]MBL7009093.1 tRNA pseudouridine(38-40) synthase TruA [Planctomycetota bacterium]